MTKRLDMEIDLCAPDEVLEQFLAGGTLLVDNSVALLAPSAVSATLVTAGGALPAGPIAYQVTTLGRYGETTPGTAFNVTATGATSVATVTWTAPVTGTVVAYKIYRKIGSNYAWVGQVPAGTLSFADIGASPLGGGPPTVNGSAGPGTVGYAAPDVNIVGAPNGVGLEVWTKAIVNGNSIGYRRWLYPWVRNLVRDNYTLDNNPVDNIFKGEGYPNPNFGSGPVNDWPLTSSKLFQRALETSFPASTNGPVLIP